jgi:hypothetical protein
VTGTLNRLDNAALDFGADASLAPGKNAPPTIQEAREQWDILVVYIFGANFPTDAATAATLFALDIFGRAFDGGLIITVIALILVIIVVVITIVIITVVAVEIVSWLKLTDGAWQSNAR